MSAVGLFLTMAAAPNNFQSYTGYRLKAVVALSEMPHSKPTSGCERLARKGGLGLDILDSFLQLESVNKMGATSVACHWRSA